MATQKNTNKGPIFRRGNGVWAQIGTAPHGLRTVWGIDQMRYAGGNDGVIYSGPPIDPLRNGYQQSLPPNVTDTLFAPIIYSIGGNSTKAVMAAADFDITLFFDGAIGTHFRIPSTVRVPFGRYGVSRAPTSRSIKARTTSDSGASRARRPRYSSSTRRRTSSRTPIDGSGASGDLPVTRSSASATPAAS